MGQLAYAVALSTAKHNPVCSLPLQSSLRLDKEVLVSAVDDTLTLDVIADLPGLMSGSVLPALDDGEL